MKFRVPRRDIHHSAKGVPGVLIHSILVLVRVTLHVTQSESFLQPYQKKFQYEDVVDPT